MGAFISGMFGISIHAPIVGCDINLNRVRVELDDFNPRTHRGVRQYKADLYKKKDWNFNPRTHRGVRQWIPV